MAFSTYHIQKALPLRNLDYFVFLQNAIHNARKRVWSAVFIINPLVDLDIDLTIRNLLKELSYARWRNVDIKMIIGTSKIRDITVPNCTAISYLNEFGITALTLGRTEKRTLHSKYVIIDDELILVGSHNWSPGAAGTHNEDSIAIYSEDMNILLRDEFTYHWDIALSESSEG